MKNLLIGLAALLFLGGCTMAQRAFVNEAVETAKDTKDTEAKLLAASLCAIGIGALNRSFDASQRDAINTLCGGE